ncbi:hypothetical protein V5799_005555 [Amblyomma americanum]|uniref:M13 family peptidase n=1 Tax=Amblyomma americanum TaxID=6943 RepID=A0AAQ4DYX6_AMBAM
MMEWQAALEGMNGSGEYHRRWKKMKFMPASDSAIYRSYETRMTIFRMFSDKVGSKREALPQFSLGAASVYTSFASDLTQLLNEHIKTNLNFTKDDVMTFEDAHLLEVVNAAFARFNNAELLQHVLWLFIDVYGPIADPTLLIPPGNGQESNKTWLRYCSFQVESSYYLLVNALFVISHLTPVERQFISELTGTIHLKAVQLIRDANWLEWRSKSMAIAKLEGLQTVLWPRHEFLTEDSLSDIYRSFPDNASSFSDYWLRTRQALRNYTAQNPQLTSELLGAPGGYDQIISYVHVLNTEFVSMAALASPLFYESGTQAMLYGGLGYQYARQLVRALDSTGVTVDAYGSIVPQWLSGSSAADYWKRVKCLGAVDEDIFPDLPALELAYLAYISATQMQGPKLFPSKTEEQVFFMTACLGMCKHQRGRSEKSCNKALVAFRPFAEAFQCDSSSEMRFPEKCPFFR